MSNPELSQEEQEKLDRALNEEIALLVLYKPTSQYNFKNIKRKEIRAYTDAVMQSLKKNYPDATEGDIWLLTVDWENKTVNPEIL